MRRSSPALLGLATLVTLVASLAPLAPARADHRADPPATVTLVGSLQDEVGCAEDWAPACEASGFEQLADGSWELETDVPPGTYEYKVAVNGSWDENYGLGGAQGGDDISLALDAETEVTFFYDRATNAVWAEDAGGAVLAGEQPAE